MTDYMTLIKTLVPVIVFVLLSFLGRGANLKKRDRSKQIFMPVVAFIYSVAGMIFANKICDKLIVFIGTLPDKFYNLAANGSIPSAISPLLTKLGDFIAKTATGLDLNFWIFFIANILFMIVFLILKRVIVNIMKKSVKTDSEIFEKTAGRFYAPFPGDDAWYLRPRAYDIRELMHVFFIATEAVLMAVMMISSSLYEKGLFKAIYIPAFGIIVVGELFHCLDGLRAPGDKAVTGENDDATHIVNYTLLRKYLRNLFGDKLLSEDTGVNNNLDSGVTNEEIISAMRDNDDRKQSIYAEFVAKMNKEGKEIDRDYLNSSIDLLDGKSILFNNPFYADLIPYAFYPMNRHLLSHGKVLVILGRHGVEEDIKEWIYSGIDAVTGIRTLWNVNVLGIKPSPETDIGIITRSDILSPDVHDANEAFFEKVGYVVILEPSKLISTAQTGLNLVIRKCGGDKGKKITYCLCDKNCDGLVDAMSHILLTNITEVSATGRHDGTVSYMCWDSDSERLHHRLLPNISRYLGFGTELSFAALRNQVSKTAWYGGEAFPVTDINWIDRQYYFDLMKYAGRPTNQNEMDNCFITSSNVWSAEKSENAYMTVEDESNNMFEVLRDFATRTTGQGFVNVISSDYLLKEYMSDNASIFCADPKAIPLIVPDFARTNRNEILKLVLLMSSQPVPEKTIENSFSLLGIPLTIPELQLWHELYLCTASVAEIALLPEDYREAVSVTSLRSVEIGGIQFTSDVICKKISFNIDLGETETLYSIGDREFISKFVFDLQSAGYVTEDEKGGYNFLGSELRGHVYQRHLPGQFFTFSGKYYEMAYLTAEGRILLRRAADHIKGRPTYSQIRRYTVHNIKGGSKVGSGKDIAGLRVERLFADFSVDTDGYYTFDKYNDFSTAKKTLFTDENLRIPTRHYFNKEILRVELPLKDGEPVDARVRYTITTLFNEVFRTVFAEYQPFIRALTADDFIEEGKMKPMTCTIGADECELGENSIFFIEDSSLDLGLTEAVERNLDRIFRIIQDYLTWHGEKLETSINPPVDPRVPIVFSPAGETDRQEKRSLWQRIKDFFARRKKKKKGEKEPAVPEGGATPVIPGNGVQPPVPGNGETPENPEGGEQPPVPENGEDPAIPENGEQPVIPEGGEQSGIPDNGEQPEIPEYDLAPASPEYEEEPASPEYEEEPVVPEYEEEPVSSEYEEEPVSPDSDEQSAFPGYTEQGGEPV